MIDFYRKFELIYLRDVFAVKGALWNRIALRLKFVYLISLTKKCVMDLYDNRTISYQACIITRFPSHASTPT